MIEPVRVAVVQALRERYGSGVVIVKAGSGVERIWSWEFPIRVGGSFEADLLLKIPRWPEAQTLEGAVAAGEQPSTVAEYEALVSIGNAVADSADPGLTMVEPIAFLPAVNGILMRRLEGRSLRRAVRPGSRGRDIATLFSRVGRLVNLIHGIGSPSRRSIDGEVVAAEVGEVAVAAQQKVPELGFLLRRLAGVGEALDGVAEPVGRVHGDLNMSNVLVDQAGRVAVIDPNPAEGPQLADVALLSGDIRFDRWQLAPAGWIVSTAGRGRWAAALQSASGVENEIAWPFREALALGERWLRVESETSGVYRAGLFPARRLLGRELRWRVETLAG